MKRALDVVVSLILLTILSPVILLIIVLVRIKIGLPVFFRQKRPGLHAVPFYIYKFRTMTEERDESGKLLPDSVRLRSFGRFLRKYSLDELPQLWNVLRGDLSLVGPRPLLMEYIPLYTEEQARRHDVKPGITGWAQVNGRNALTWEEKFILDVWYVNHHSFWLDIKILMMTFLKVIRSEDINSKGHATMPVFTGKSEQSKRIEM